MKRHILWLGLLLLSACTQNTTPTQAPDPTPDFGGTPALDMGGADVTSGEDLRQEDVEPEEPSPESRFALVAPRVPAQGGLWPVRVHVLDMQEEISKGATGRVLVPSLRVDGEPVALDFVRGVGSATLELTPGQEVTWAQEALPTSDATPRQVRGALAGDDLLWRRAEVIHVLEEITIPQGDTLIIKPGVTILLSPGVNIRVRGRLVAWATAEEPALWAPALGQPWGGLIVYGEASFAHHFLVGGGGDTARPFGHSSSQPMIEIKPQARLSMDACTLQDGPGKAFGAREARVELQNTLIARLDTGGEFENSALSATHCWWTSFPGPGASPDEDDNDALYLKGALSVDGEVVPSVIEDSVLMGGQDDGIDHNGATVHAERLWIEGFANEGVATSTGGRFTLRDSVVTRCEQGIEAGYGAPVLVGEHLLLMDNEVGARYGDSYDWEVEGSLQVRHSVFLDNTRQAVRNYLLRTDAPGPDDSVEIRSCVLDDTSYPHDTNTQGRARLDDLLQLEQGSPGASQNPDQPSPGLLTGQARQFLP